MLNWVTTMLTNTEAVLLIHRRKNLLIGVFLDLPIPIPKHQRIVSLRSIRRIQTTQITREFNKFPTLIELTGFLRTT